MLKLNAGVAVRSADRQGVPSRQRRREEAFTLIELLVVIIIIGILAALALLLFFNQQAEAIKASVKSDVRNTVGNIVQSLVKTPTADPLTATPVQTGENEVKIVGAWNDYAVYGSNDSLEGWVYAHFANADGELSQAAEAGTPAYGQWRELTTAAPGAGGDGDEEDVTKDGVVGFAHKWFECTGTGFITVTATSASGPVALMVEDWWNTHPNRNNAIVYEADGSATWTVDVDAGASEGEGGINGGTLWAFSETTPTVTYSGSGVTCDGGSMYGSPHNDGLDMPKQDAWAWNANFPDWAGNG